MDKQQAQELIKNTFEKPFDKEKFSRFIRNFLNRIEDAQIPASPLFSLDYAPSIVNSFPANRQLISTFHG